MSLRQEKIGTSLRTGSLRRVIGHCETVEGRCPGRDEPGAGVVGTASLALLTWTGARGCGCRGVDRPESFREVKLKWVKK
jgi:hypothetical protein